MVKYHAPRRGSLAFRRKRARRIYPGVFSWPEIDKVNLLGFPAYKVGMLTIKERNLLVGKRAMWYNLERVVAATVLEAPPIRILGVRAYEETPYGLRSLMEAWTPYLTEQDLKYLGRKFTVSKRGFKERKEIYEANINRMEELIGDGKISEVRAIISTLPHLTGIGKKKPEIMEIKVGGDPTNAFNWIKERIGKFVRITEVFEPGMFIDLIGVTKGKGFQGVVKRFGVTLLPPKSKKGRRRIGTLGPWTPGRIMYTVPRPGQLGFFRRTEFNKQIMSIIPSLYEIKYNFEDEENKKFYELSILDSIKISGDLAKALKTAKKIKSEKADKEKKPEAIFENAAYRVNPKGAWPHYGIVRNDVVIIRGSVMGPQKRLIFMRYPIRPKKLKADLQIFTFYYGRDKLFDYDLVEDALKVLSEGGEQ